MQKIIRLETENTPLERWTENSACEIYSHDTNNGHFEIEVMNEALTDESVTALFIFEESQSVWRTEGTVEDNKIKFKFDTTLITQDETVVCVLYLDNERENNDFYRFNFKVKVSEIDKLDNLTIKERLFKNNLIIDRLEVVTKDELKEALKTLDLSSISTEGLLTEEKANGLYAKISELEAVESKLITQEQLTSTKNEVVTEINNRLENYALKTNIPEPYNDTNLVSRVSDLERKTDKDTIYDDSDLKARISVLESREDKNTIYDDTSVRERLTVLENKPNVDISNLATKEELETVRGSQPNIDNLVTKQELEEKHYITGAALENYALKSDIPQGYNDTEVKERLTVLENKQDKDTVYNDTELRNRVSELEQRPIATPYNDTVLSDRVSALETKQDKDTVYNDSELRQRVEVLENKVDKDTVYNDEPIKERLTVLESKPNIDLSSYATKDELKAKVSTSDYDTFKSMVVTKGYLESKNYLTEQYNDKPLTDRVVALESKPSVDLSNYVTKQELQEATEIDYSNLVTTDELEPYAKKSELPTPYNDSALVSRVSALESKQDKDTVYNDTEVKQRLTALENRPTSGGGLGTEDVATYTNNIIYVPNGNIVYDKNLKKLYVPKCNVHVGKTSYWCEAQEVSINGSAGFIVFNKAQKRIVGGSVNSTNDVLLGYYDNNIGNYYLNTFSKALKKKKIACLGDSITEGVNANGWQWHRYIDKYFKENGVETTIVNLGIGGTSVCTSSYVTASLQPFVNRLNTIPTDTDVIVIFGGTNDWGNNATLGTISDSGSSSFYGAYRYMLEWFANNRPNAKILTITPLKRYFRGNTSTWTNAQTTRNNKGQLLQDYVRAVKEVSEIYAIPCVDLHNESGLNPVLEIVRTKYMGDGLHPTAEGNKKMYPIILNKLKPLVEYD